MSGMNINAIFNENDDTGFLYTVGRFNGPFKQEFFSRDVPRDKVESLARTMNYLKDREVLDGHTIQSNGLNLMAMNPVECINHIHRDMTCLANPEAGIMEIIPAAPSNSIQDWGSSPFLTSVTWTVSDNCARK